MALSEWSTSPANNASGVTNVNWAEGQAPSTVNNSARQEMTDVADWYRNSAEWIDRDDAISFSSGTKVLLTSQDVTSTYNVGRRIQVTAVTPGTLYGLITASSTSGSDTALTIDWDSTAVLVSEAISDVAIGIISASSAKQSLDVSGVANISTFSRSYLDDTTSSDFRTTLGIQEDVITTRGDIIRGSTAGTSQRLALGTSGQILTSDGSDAVWDGITVGSTDMPTATTSAQGAVELATAAEVKTGTDTSRASPVSSLISHEGIAKGWVNFNGTGTVAIRDSFNVSSITDNGTGDYTVNWGTDFADANYAACITAGSVGGDTFQDRILAQAAGSVQFRTASHTPVAGDATFCYAIGIGDR